MLTYYPNYITKEKEKQILSIIPPFVRNNTNERNRVFRYGSRLPYTSFFVSENIPEVFNGLGVENFDSVTINEYAKGQIIDYHIDDKNAGDKIVVLSLLGSAELTFRKQNQIDKKQFMTIEPLSLYVMEGSLRWEYEHKAIANDLRYSVVFRKHTPKENVLQIIINQKK